MSGSQLEQALNLIDQNLLLNRDEVLGYISSNPFDVATALERDGKVEIPTSAGPIIIDRERLGNLT